VSDEVVPLDKLPASARERLAPPPQPATKPGEIPVDTRFAAPPAKRDLTEGMDRVDTVRAGAGKTLMDAYRGMMQNAGADNQGEIDEAAAHDTDLLNNPWGMTGAMGAGAATSAIPGFGVAKLAQGLGAAAKAGYPVGRAGAMLANPYGNAGASGAAYNALMQPVESGGSRGAQAGAGLLSGLAGNALSHGLGALVRPATAGVSSAVRQLADKAEQWGIPIRAADISSNPLLGTLQRALDYLPFSGGHQQRELAQKAFNSKLASTMGESTDDITQALGSARPRIGDVYDTVLGRNVAEIDPGLHGQKLLKTFNDFKRTDTTPGKQLSETLDNYLANLIEAPNAKQNPVTGKYEMPGDVYKQFRSEAGKLARSYKRAGEAGTNPHGSSLAEFFNEVKHQLDHAIRTSSTMTPEDAAAIKLADKQWGNMRTLERLAPADASGDVDFNKLAKVLTQKDANNVYNRDAFTYGTHDQTLPDVARIGTQFLGRGLPPTHLKPWVQKSADALQYGAAPLAVTGGLYSMNMHDDHPVLSTLGELGALAATSKLGGSALNSRWFARGAHPAVRSFIDAAASPTARQLPPAALATLLRRGEPLSFMGGVTGEEPTE